jgi:hypothetical protein
MALFGDPRPGRWRAVRYMDPADLEYFFITHPNISSMEWMFYQVDLHYVQAMEHSQRSQRFYKGYLIFALANLVFQIFWFAFHATGK